MILKQKFSPQGMPEDEEESDGETNMQDVLAELNSSRANPSERSGISNVREIKKSLR